MAQHLRFFRFSNRTHIEKNEDLHIEDFFEEYKADKKDSDPLSIEDTIKQKSGPKRDSGFSSNDKTWDAKPSQF